MQDAIGFAGELRLLRGDEAVGELLSVAAAMPGIAVIVRWARRRRA